MARILVVDDDEHIRKLYKRILEERGHEVTRAPNAEDAMRLFRNVMRLFRNNHVWDLVITSVRLSGACGVELTAKIKEEHPELPVLIVSGGQPPHHRANAFLPKPFRPDALMAHVDLLTKKD